MGERRVVGDRAEPVDDELGGHAVAVDPGEPLLGRELDVVQLGVEPDPTRSRPRSRTRPHQPGEVLLRRVGHGPAVLAGGSDRSCHSSACTAGSRRTPRCGRRGTRGRSRTGVVAVVVAAVMKVLPEVLSGWTDGNSACGPRRWR